MSEPVIRRIAWSTKSAGNGHICQWSRWHLVRTLELGEKTLCGVTVPHEKWITPQPGDERGDDRIKGGECQRCKRLAVLRVDQLINELRYCLALIETNLNCGSDLRVGYAKTLVSHV